MLTYCKNAKRLEILYETKAIKGNDCQESVYNTANFHHFWNCLLQLQLLWSLVFNIKNAWTYPEYYLDCIFYQHFKYTILLPLIFCLYSLNICVVYPNNCDASVLKKILQQKNLKQVLEKH